MVKIKILVVLALSSFVGSVSAQEIRDSSTGIPVFDDNFEVMGLSIDELLEAQSEDLYAQIDGEPREVFLSPFGDTFLKSTSNLNCFEILFREVSENRRQLGGRTGEVQYLCESTYVSGDKALTLFDYYFENDPDTSRRSKFLMPDGQSYSGSMASMGEPDQRIKCDVTELFNKEDIRIQTNNESCVVSIFDPITQK